jgi:hypothetical protein
VLAAGSLAVAKGCLAITLQQQEQQGRALVLALEVAGQAGPSLVVEEAGQGHSQQLGKGLQRLCLCLQGSRALLQHQAAVQGPGHLSVASSRVLVGLVLGLAVGPSLAGSEGEASRPVPVLVLVLVVASEAGLGCCSTTTSCTTSSATGSCDTHSQTRSTAVEPSRMWAVECLA